MGDQLGNDSKNIKQQKKQIGIIAGFNLNFIDFFYFYHALSLLYLYVNARPLMFHHHKVYTLFNLDEALLKRSPAKIKIYNLEDISFRFIPSPHLVIKKADFKIKESETYSISKLENIKIKRQQAI